MTNFDFTLLSRTRLYIIIFGEAFLHLKANCETAQKSSPGLSATQKQTLSSGEVNDDDFSKHNPPRFN
jgi:hypothetical protein